MALCYNTKKKKEGNHMGKHILLINDLPGYGKVALAAMMPVLAHLGHHLYNLPTALVSNTLDYGKFEILETTDYMKKSLAVWKELNFSFDAISTGFIVSGEQAELIASYCGEERKKGTYIFVDPIMGDEGHLYNGIPDSTVDAMRRLVSHADCAVPNYTEAALLAGIPYREEGTSEREMRKIIDAIRRIGAASVVVTSAFVEGQHAVAGYDEVRGNYFLLPFESIPVRFPGTGDIFSAILLGHVENGMPLREAVQKAMDAVAALISANRDNADTFKGIPLEQYLEVIS